MELTIKINTEDNIDLEKIEKDCKDISISALKKAVDSIKKIETTIQKAIDTSEFKVGDYIRYKNRTDIVGRITAINNFSQYNVETNVGKCCADIDFIEKWTPKKGDLCIFWDYDKSRGITLIFGYIEYDDIFIDNRGINWENCVPFINEVHFKEVVGYAV